MVVQLILGGALSLFGLIFRNTVMQLVGGAILIYALGALHILPTWMIVILSLIFLFLITKK